MGKSHENLEYEYDASLNSLTNEKESEKDATFKIKNLDDRFNDISLIPEAWKESEYTTKNNTNHQTFKTI